MNVTINVFDYDYNYLVKRSITGQQIFDTISDRIGLKNRSMFGLQAYHEQIKSRVWIKPTKRMIDSIQQGLQFEPKVYLYLRARHFPANFDELVQQDSVAMNLYYRQISQRWVSGYDPNSPVELCLLSLMLLNEIGQLADVLNKTEWNHLVNVVKQYLTKSAEPNRGAECCLRLWSLFGSMQSCESIFNYLNIAMNMSNYQCETITFPVQNMADEKAIIGIGFNGICIKQEQQQQPQSIELNWAEIEKVICCKKSIKIELRDKKTTDKMKYDCNSQYVATQLFQLLIAYHQMSLKPDQNNTGTRLIISNAEKFLQELVSNFKIDEKNADVNQTITAMTKAESTKIESQVDQDAQVQPQEISLKEKEWNQLNIALLDSMILYNNFKKDVENHLESLEEKTKNLLNLCEHIEHKLKVQVEADRMAIQLSPKQKNQVDSSERSNNGEQQTPVELVNVKTDHSYSPNSVQFVERERNEQENTDEVKDENEIQESLEMMDIKEMDTIETPHNDDIEEKEGEEKEESCTIEIEKDLEPESTISDGSELISETSGSLSSPIGYGNIKSNEQQQLILESVRRKRFAQIRLAILDQVRI
ncbi:hypothetical protein BLOT_002166 [Blomia tropicalis]|nr:hypothetical protein BLOT_002166 [Blomia tropicalis]